MTQGSFPPTPSGHPSLEAPTGRHPWWRPGPDAGLHATTNPRMPSGKSPRQHLHTRKLELGDCARPYGTPCQHEHSCLRCPMLQVGLTKAKGETRGPRPQPGADTRQQQPVQPDRPGHAGMHRTTVRFDLTCGAYSVVPAALAPQGSTLNGWRVFQVSMCCWRGWQSTEGCASMSWPMCRLSRRLKCGRCSTVQRRARRCCDGSPPHFSCTPRICLSSLRRLCHWRWCRSTRVPEQGWPALLGTPRSCHGRTGTGCAGSRRHCHKRTAHGRSRKHARICSTRQVPAACSCVCSPTGTWGGPPEQERFCP